MVIDTSILDEYIRMKSVTGIQEHWIFNRIVEGEHLFECPPIEYMDKIIELRNLLVRELEDFQPINKSVWQEVLGYNHDILKEQKVMLIIGAPKPYDALVRMDEDNNKIIIFDLERLRNYSNITEVINSIITHEMVHILIHNEQHLYRNGLNNEELLKQLMFDEGFAHYISFKKMDDLSMDKQEYSRYRQEAYKELQGKLKDSITDQVLIQGNSGQFWSKYIAISGFFTIVDYLLDSGTLKDLYSKGYDYFWNYWLSISKG